MQQEVIRNRSKSPVIELSFEALTAVYVVGVVVFCWQYPLLCFLLLGVGLGVQFWFWREKADAAMMIAAAVLGTPSEMICVKYGVWSYHAPGLMLGIPVWIPLVWAYLFCLFRRISITAHSFILSKYLRGNIIARRIFFGTLGCSILVYYIFTILVIKKIIAVVFSIFMIPAVIFWHRERDILIFLIGAALGTLGEYMCMRLGFWEYHHPFFRSIGLPISLPLAWGLSAVITGRIAGIWEKKAS